MKRKIKRIRIKPELRDDPSDTALAKREPDDNARVIANRKNALASTGPKSLEGKRKVARNALVHGASSKALLLPGESAKALQQHRQEICVALGAQGYAEECVADTFSLMMWRQRRIFRAEAAACEMIHDRAERIALNRALEGVTPEHVKKMSCIPNLANAKVLLRYEAATQRAMHKTLSMLHAMQQQRGKQEASAMLTWLLYQTNPSSKPDVVEGEIVDPPQQ